MRYSGLSSRLRAVERELGPRVLRIRIVGGLPEGYQAPASRSLPPADSEPTDQPAPKPSGTAE
jgi:hypothetical protein